MGFIELFLTGVGLSMEDVYKRQLFDGAVASAAGTGSIDFDAIGRILLATLALYLLSAACSWVQSWVCLLYTSRCV